MRTSSKAAIAAAVVASWHSLGDGGAVVSAFVVPTGARAHLASKASTSRMMVGAGAARYAAAAAPAQLTMDLSSITAPDVRGVSLPSVELSSVDLTDIEPALQSLLDKVSPQVQALLNYVAAELNTSWAAYVAKLTAGDSATITVTGWSALILVAIAANTAARGGAEAKKKKAEEAAAAAAEKKATVKNPFASGLSVPKGVSLQEVADVGRRLASGGGTVAVGGIGGTKAKSSAAVAKKQQQQVPKAKVKPAPVVKKTPVYNPLAGKRSEILAAKNKKKTPFASFGAGKSAFAKKLAAAPVKKKAVAAAKPFKNASAAGTAGALSFSDLIADFQSKDEAEQRKLIGASVAALLVGGAALGGGGSSPAPPTPKPAPRSKPSAKSKPAPLPEPAPAPVPVVKEVVEVKAAEEPASEAKPKREPIPEAISPPPAPIIVETPPPAPATKPKMYESKVGKESFSSKLLEPIGGPSTPSPAPMRVMRPAPPALTKEPWFKKSINAYLEENAVEGDLASNAPLIAAGLLGLIATRSTMESSKEMREQKQDAMDILEAAGSGELDETDVLIQQLDTKIAFFKDDDDLRKALEVVRDELLVLQAKKKSLDA